MLSALIVIGKLTGWSVHRNTSTNPGRLIITSADSDYTIDIPLILGNGLYYCNFDDFMATQFNSIHPQLHLLNKHPLDPTQKWHQAPSAPKPMTRAKQIEAELWSACLGFPAEWQLDIITQHMDGLPVKLDLHPFTLNLDKADAGVSKWPVGKHPLPVREQGFMCASAFDYTHPDLENDHFITSYNGFNLYLAIVDELSKYVWVLLSRSKEPPTAIVSAFLARFGHSASCQHRTDQGGKISCSEAFRTTMFDKHKYVVESTGVDSPSQNGQVKCFNQSLATTVQVLLYSAGLHAKFWLAALLHAVYLHNW